MSATAIDSLRGILNGFRDLNSKGIYTMNGTETDLLRQIFLEVQALSIGGGLADGSVTTPKIADLNVTQPKLAANSVITAKILDANVTPVKLSQPYTQGTPFSLSGVSSDVTSIPSWVTQILVKFANLSTNGTSIPILQLGDSGGIETTGYDGSASVVTSAPSVAAASISNGLALTTSIVDTTLLNGQISISRISSSTNLWSMAFLGSFQGGGITVQSFASKALSAELTQLRLTTFGGTESFDSGRMIDARRLRLALHQLNLLETIESAIVSLGKPAQIDWEYATEIKEDYPLVLALANSLGLDTESIFTLAMSLN